MVNLSEDIRPLTEFKRDAARLIEQMKKTGRPLVLTRNGKASVVAMSVATYEMMLHQLEWVDSVAAIQRGIDAVERGDMRPAEEVFDELRRKHGLSR